jgi:hypothetical protein
MRGPAPAEMVTNGSLRMRSEYETRLGADQLAALSAVIEFGSFDAAACDAFCGESTHQGLEQEVGQVLAIREKPCGATSAGVALLRLAAQMALLESEALAEEGGGGSIKQPLIAIVINADSMSATSAGVPLLRLAAQTAMLESEALAETGGGSPELTRAAIAVNADRCRRGSSQCSGNCLTCCSTSGSRTRTTRRDC